jgi:hypothetical protein
MSADPDYGDTAVDLQEHLGAAEMPPLVNKQTDEGYAKEQDVPRQH